VAKKQVKSPGKLPVQPAILGKNGKTASDSSDFVLLLFASHSRHYNPRNRPEVQAFATLG
jgi:hypothetical protein